MTNNDNDLGNASALQPQTTYRVAQAPLGHCIVMRDDEGRETVIEAGIKSWASAKKKRDLWEKLEAQARLREAKRAPTND